jgi:hypothetical protein
MGQLPWRHGEPSSNFCRAASRRIVRADGLTAPELDYLTDGAPRILTASEEVLMA